MDAGRRDARGERVAQGGRERPSLHWPRLRTIAICTSLAASALAASALALTTTTLALATAALAANALTIATALPDRCAVARRHGSMAQ